MVALDLLTAVPPFAHPQPFLTTMTRLLIATLVLALATIIGGAAAAANEQYTWAAADGTPFTVKDVSLHTDNPDGFSYDAVAPAAAIAARHASPLLT